MTLALGQIDRKYVRVVHTPQILSISLVLTIRLIPVNISFETSCVRLRNSIHE